MRFFLSASWKQPHIRVRNTLGFPHEAPVIKVLYALFCFVGLHMPMYRIDNFIW